MDYKKKITNELIEDILKKGVRDMPQNPGAQGYSERQIRAFYYLPEKETLAVMSEIEDELIKTINGETTVGVAHHLQKKTPLYNAENPIDFNDFLETGEYGFGSNDNMLYVSNSPITQGGTLIVTSCFKPTANKNTVWACRRQEFITCYGVWQRCETVDSYGKHTGWEKWKRFVTDIDTVDNAKYAVEAHHFRKVILDENTPINSNEFLECGHYGVNDKLAKSSKNIPDTAGGTLIVSSFFTSHPNTDSKWAYRTQEYFNRNGRWFRSEAIKEDGSHYGWTDWKHFVINEDLTEYQKTIDNLLNTESKKIPEAINEVNSNLVKDMSAKVQEQKLTIELKDKDGNVIASSEVTLPKQEITGIDLSAYVKTTDRNEFVKQGVTENNLTLTDEEKINALNWLGAVKKAKQTTYLAGKTIAYCANFDGEGNPIDVTTMQCGSMLDDGLARYSQKRLRTDTPTQDNHCVNLKYFNDNIGSGGKTYYKHMVNITCSSNDLAPINDFTFTFISSESSNITQILGYGETKRTITFNEIAQYILVKQSEENPDEMTEELSNCIILSLAGSTEEASLDYPVRYRYKGAIYTAIAYDMHDTVTEV